MPFFACTRLLLISHTSSFPQSTPHTRIYTDWRSNTCVIFFFAILVHTALYIHVSGPFLYLRSVVRYVGASCQGLASHSLPSLVYPQHWRRHTRSRCSSKRSAKSTTERERKNSKRKKRTKNSVSVLTQTSHGVAARLRFLCLGKMLCSLG